MTRDPRLTPAREDLAAAHLEGAVSAARFAEATPRVVAAPLAPVTASPDGRAEMTTQLVWGEAFDAYEETGLWAWGQARGDGYVGYVPRTCLEAPEALGGPPTHRVAALSAPVYPEPDFKARPDGQLPYAARVAVSGEEEGNQARYARLASGGWVAAVHLAPLDRPAPDWVAEAERFLGVPYLWGGRAPMGIDCSALLQLALEAGGRACPRDTDMQVAVLGRDLPAGEALARGDLVFWRGHVGVMLDGARLLHANIHHMAVVSEPLADAEARIADKDGGPVTRRARLD